MPEFTQLGGQHPYAPAQYAGSARLQPPRSRADQSVLRYREEGDPFQEVR